MAFIILEKERFMKKRILTMFLALALLLSFVPQVFAASLQDTYEGGQTQILIRSGTPHSYLDIRYTDVWTAALSGRSWSYITADGQVTGPAYCVDHGGNFPSGAIPVDTTRYTAKPQTMGAFANGYPQRSLSDFLSINSGNYPELSGLTELIKYLVGIIL